MSLGFLRYYAITSSMKGPPKAVGCKHKVFITGHPTIGIRAVSQTNDAKKKRLLQENFIAKTRPWSQKRKKTYIKV